MQNALKSIFRGIRSEAIMTLFCHPDPRAVNSINFMDSLINEDGTINLIHYTAWLAREYEHGN